MNTKLILSAAAALLLGAGQIYACGDMKKHEAAAEKKHADCPWEAPGVRTEKKAVKNGIELTLTAESPEKAAELKEKMTAHRASGCPMLGGNEVAVESQANVVKVTVTSKKAADVKKLQAVMKKGGSCCPGHEGHAAAKPQSSPWVCPMGDFEGSDKPGRCPNCGMNLVENKPK